MAKAQLNDQMLCYEWMLFIQSIRSDGEKEQLKNQFSCIPNNYLLKVHVGLIGSHSEAGVVSVCLSLNRTLACNPIQKKMII